MSVLYGNAGWKSISNINEIIKHKYYINNIDISQGKLTLFNDIAIGISVKPPGV